MFADGVALAQFTVQSVDDNIPEPSENFTIQLVAVSFRARVGSTGGSATLTGIRNRRLITDHDHCLACKPLCSAKE